MFGNMMEWMQQAQKIRGQMQSLQDSLADRTVEGMAGGGLVKVVANGKQKILSIQIAPSLVEKQDPQMLQDLVAAAVNQALLASQTMMTEEMNKIMGNLGPLASMLKGGM